MPCVAPETGLLQDRDLFDVIVKKVADLKKGKSCEIWIKTKCICNKGKNLI